MDARFPFIALLRKELLGALRLKRVWFLMLLSVAGVFLIFWYLFIMFAEMFGGGYSTLGAFSEMGMGLFAFGGMFLLCILVPALAAVSVCVEKQQGNYDLLITTLISPRGIFFGKMLNILTVYTLFLTATLPAFGALYYFVGVEWWQLVQIVFVFAVTGVHICAAGIYCSVRFYRTIATILLTYGLTLFITGLPQLAFLGVYSEVTNSHFDEYWLNISPVLVLGAILEPFIGTELSLPAFFAYHAVWIALFSALAIRALARPMRDIKVETRQPIDDQTVLDKRRKRFPYYLADPLRRRDLLPDGRNPIVYKEIASNLLGNLTRRIRVAYLIAIVTFVLSMVMTGNSNYSDWPEVVVQVLLLQTCIILLVVPAMSANLIVKEYELENMDMLRMTLLSSREILMGKVRAAWTGLMPAFVAVQLANLPLLAMSLRDLQTLGAWVSGIGAMLLCIFFTLLLSIFASLFCRRTLTALLAAYGLCGVGLVGIAIGMLITLVILGSLLGHREFGDPLDPVYAPFLYVSPLVSQFANMAEWTKPYRSPSNYLNLKWLASALYNLAVCAGVLYASHLLFRRKLNKRQV